MKHRTCLFKRRRRYEDLGSDARGDAGVTTVAAGGKWSFAVRVQAKTRL